MGFKKLELLDMLLKRNASIWAVMLALGTVPLAFNASAENGCATGFIPDGVELIADTSFANGFAGFNSDVVYRAPINTYPNDANGSVRPNTGIGILNAGHGVGGTVVSQITFPGDPAPVGGGAAVPAVSTWFAYNGNDAGVPPKIWEDTLTGLQPNTSYAFTAYFSNVLAPGNQANGLVAPLVQFRVDDVQIGDDIPVCDAGGGIDAAQGDCENEATADSWQRLGEEFTTGAAQTSVTLSLTDAARISSSGNDFAMTTISLQQCVPIGTPDISVAPASVNYASGSLNSAVTETITVTNVGTGALVIGTIPAITAADFSISQDNCSGQSLAANDNCTLLVDFAPASTGNKTGSIGIPSNDPDEATVSVALSGGIVDSDNDGIVDSVDLDDDNDGIPDVVEGNEDFDGDGIPNRLDLDSDNDGLPDVTEGLASDANRDGRVDGFVDANSDGMHDPLATERLAADWAAVDTDGDNSPDFLDLNSDNDDQFDTEEAGMADADRDGLVDNFDNSDGDGWDVNAKTVLNTRGVIDSDADGTPDYRQTVGEVITRIDGGLGSTGLSLLAGLLGAGAWRRRNLIASAAILGMAGAAQAKEGQFYIGGGLGISNLEPEVINIPDLTVEETSDSGLKLFLGYDIRDWFSIEGFFSTLGAAGLEDANPVPADAGGEIDYDVMGLGLVANYPHNAHGFSVLGKLGLATIDNSSDNVTFREVESQEIYAGVGAEYQFETGISLRAEYEYFDKDAQLISASVLKRFGGEASPPPPAPVVQPPAPKPKPEPVYVVPPAPVPEPEPIPAPTVATIQLNIDSIYFDTNKSDLKPDAIVQLDEIVQLLHTYPEVELQIVGHTDARASEAYNYSLSESRATAAWTYLQSQGIAPERLSTSGRGESEPAADNDTELGRSLNRRVDFFPTPVEVVEQQ